MKKIRDLAMNNKLLTWLDTIRTSLWFIPSTMVLCALILAKLFLAFDQFQQKDSFEMIAFLYQTSPESIRSILTTIATSMMTVTSIAFSITVVSLTLASSQFGPRLIRNFMSDKGTQTVLGAFVSIYIYCILILQATKSAEQLHFIPGAAAYFAVILAFVGVAILIYFIHHVASSIQADNVIDSVYCQLQQNITRLFPTENESSASASKEHNEHKNLGKNSAQKFEITSNKDGYLQTIDIEKLTALAEKHQLLIETVRVAGDFVVINTPLILVYSDDTSLPCDQAELLKAFTLGSKRTPIQDPEFAIHQLVEIAVRALSPGINDPYTAITCVDKLSAILCRLTQSPFPVSHHYDQEDTLRVITKPFSFNDLADSAFNQIRQYSIGSIAVSIRLIESLDNILSVCCSEEQRQFISNQLTMLEESHKGMSLFGQDKQDIESRLNKVRSELNNLTLP